VALHDVDRRGLEHPEPVESGVNGNVFGSTNLIG
jgi:hypothetical protein